MKLQVLVQDEPTGTPYEQEQVRVVDPLSGAAVPGAGSLTDAEGFVAVTRSAQPSPVWVLVEGQAGGTRVWDSRDAFAAGAVPLLDVPAALFDLEGVVAGYGSAFAVSLGDPGWLHIGTGAAVVAGHPVVVYAPFQRLEINRPASTARVDRVALRVERATGVATVVYLPGDPSGVPAPLTQDATTWEQGLWQVSTPTPGGPLEFTDDRVWANQVPDVAATSGPGEIATASATGVAVPGAGPGLGYATLALLRPTTYDVAVDASALQVSTAPTTWVPSTTAPPPNGLALNGPGQIAHDPNGYLYVVDPGNNRVVILNASDGSYLHALSGFAGPTGVCLDSLRRVYVAYVSGTAFTIRKFSGYPLGGANALLATASGTMAAGATTRHLATDDTFVYGTTNTSTVFLRNCSDLAAAGAIAVGVNTWGIAYNAHLNEIWVVDSGNHRVQRYTTTGTYVAVFGSFGLGTNQYGNPRGIAVSPGPAASTQQIWIADRDNHRLVRVNHAGVSQEVVAHTSPDGVAVPSLSRVWADGGLNTVQAHDLSGGGHGEIGLALLGGAASYANAYLGIGNRDGEVQNAISGTAVGPATVQAVAYVRALSGTVTLRNVLVNARAVPRS